jgi:hypothetical protein
MDLRFDQAIETRIFDRDGRSVVSLEKLRLLANEESVRAAEVAPFI